jgi:hypothetical protein
MGCPLSYRKLRTAFPLRISNSSSNLNLNSPTHNIPVRGPDNAPNIFASTSGTLNSSRLNSIPPTLRCAMLFHLRSLLRPHTSAGLDADSIRD